MVKLPPKLLDAVVAFGIPGPVGTSWNGTGFLYGIPARRKGGHHLFLVSNRHVFQGKQECVLRFNSMLDDEPSIDFAAPLIARNGREKWVGHPDADVDVAAISIKRDVLEQNDRRFTYFASESMAADRDALRRMAVSEGDGVFVLGFPMGIVGAEDRQYVICRSGNIARIQDMLAGGNEYLIDAMVFPGNSGGPVILRPGATGEADEDALLIGIVKSYLAFEDSAYSERMQTLRLRIHENSGLATVVGVDLIEETVQLAHTRARRRASSARSRSQ